MEHSIKITSLPGHTLIHRILCTDKTSIRHIQFKQQVWPPSTFPRPLVMVHEQQLSQTRLQTLMINCRCKMSRWDWAIYGKICTCSQAESLKMRLDGKSTDKMGGSAFTRWQVCPWPTYGSGTHTLRWLNLTTKVFTWKPAYKACLKWAEIQVINIETDLPTMLFV